MKCACGENEARYINERGELCCGICPLKQGLDSIKLGDVPALLKWARDVLAGGFMGGYSFGALRDIIGRKAGNLDNAYVDRFKEPKERA
jgi:hypothetical protein